MEWNLPQTLSLPKLLLPESHQSNHLWCLTLSALFPCLFIALAPEKQLEPFFFLSSWFFFSFFFVSFEMIYVKTHMWVLPQVHVIA